MCDDCGSCAKWWVATLRNPARAGIVTGVETNGGGQVTSRVWWAAVAAALAAVAGCAGEPAAEPAAGAVGAPPPLVDSAPAASRPAPTGKFVMIIRHGEKPGKKGGGPGVDAAGRPDDSSLTSVGWQRARALAEALDGQGPVPASLAEPMAIYAAGERSGGKGIRTVETVQPLAEKIRLPVNTRFGKGEERALAQSVAAQPGPTLISRSRRC